MIGLLDAIVSRARLTSPQEVNNKRTPFVRRTRAGVVVTPDIALTYAAIWACTRIISETLATVPWFVLKRVSPDVRERQDNNPVELLLNRKSNRETTAFDFKQTIFAHVLLWGNGYAEIDRSRSGVPRALWLMAPDRVRPGRLDDGSLAYEVQQSNGDNVILPASRVLHFRGLGFDGVEGYSVVEVGAQSMGLGMAMERYGSEFFGNGAHPGGVLEHPNQLDDETHERMRKSLLETTGAGNWLSPLILEDGIKWQSIGLKPSDAQVIESRKFQITEVARWFRIQPHKLADLERATIANIEQQNIEFVTDTIMPWAVRFEQEVDTKLLGEPKVFSRFKLDGLLRGDIKSRNEAHKIGREWGWLSANDIRTREDMNPIPADQGGDVYLVPMNMQSSERLLDDPEPPSGGQQGLQGDTGADGSDGADGQDGQPGERGERGHTGLQGESGMAGSDGQGGQSGEQGEAGAAGADGHDGEQGLRGEVGNDGADGAVGQAGQPGESGMDGSEGQQGEQGLQGESGADGAAGQDGQRGERGERGECGDSGDTGDRGERGAKGQQGESGRDGQAYGPAIRNLLRECVQKLCRTEAGMVEAAWKRGESQDFPAWCEPFYDRHRAHMTEKLWNTVLSLVELAGGQKAGRKTKRNLRTVIESYVAVRCMQSLDEIRESSDMAGLFESWRDDRIAADSEQLMRSLAMPVLLGVVADASANAK